MVVDEVGNIVFDVEIGLIDIILFVIMLDELGIVSDLILIISGIVDLL